MYQFIWPIVLLLLPLPLLLRQVLKASSFASLGAAGALKVPFFERIQQLNASPARSERLIPPILWVIAWFCFVVAAARPVWLGEPVTLNKDARNIMLTLDVSGSMEESDFDMKGRPLTRLEMVKRLAKDFINERKGDNLGLVIFADEAYTYAPLSPDTKTLSGLMNEINLGIAGTQTAMGDALAMAVQAVASVPENARIVILMSDGFANAGVIQMQEALELAKNANVKVYTIGIGSDKKTVQDFLGFIQMSGNLDLDEETLNQIAKQTGGQYFRAKSTEDLAEIYRLIDQLETSEAEDITVQPRKEMAFLFILAGLGFWLIAFMIGRRV